MFELEHIAGTGIDRLISFANRRRMEERLAGAEPILVTPEIKRLQLTASFAAGRDMRVVALRGDALPRPYLPLLRKTYHPALLPEHGFCWTDGATLYLPESIVGMPDDSLQGYLLKLMVFFLSAQASSGSLAPGQDNALSSDRALADIYWITENSRLHAVLAKEFPALFGEWEKVVSRLIDQRPERAVLRPGEAAVEAYLRETLLSLSLDRVKAVSSEESLKIALTIKKRMEESGISFKNYRAVVPLEPWGKFMPGSALTTALTRETGGNESAGNAGSGLKKQKDAPRYATQRREVDEKANEAGWMLNIYDKILSWAGFANVNRPFDDDPDDEASKKADDMDEITVASLERRTNAHFDAELERLERAFNDASDKGQNIATTHIYPEWDYKKRAYRSDYVRLKEEDAPTDSGGRVADKDSLENRKLVKDVKRKFEALRPRPALARRLFDGELIDVDALVEAVADLSAGRQPDERFYASYAKTERDISTLFLVDLSMSTDAWVKDKRVIEHEKEAILLLCEAISKLGDRYAVHGFSGQSHKGARFFRIKGFDEPYNVAARARIKGLIPYHYTRMGPAIRHASKLLEAERARIKLLFILSDGKPNDIDVYEGRYGIEDTRKAVREAEARGITPFCFTLDLKAGEYLPRLFGRGNYSVASGADKLARTLPDLYGRIIRSL